MGGNRTKLIQQITGVVEAAWTHIKALALGATKVQIEDLGIAQVTIKLLRGNIDVKNLEVTVQVADENENKRKK